MPRRRSKPKKGEHSEVARLDDAARAGWLYYIAGNTQDEIASKLDVSRPTAQRLVSLALSERLITFRLDHPIAACMELARRLVDRFQLSHCDVVPTDPKQHDQRRGVAGSRGRLSRAEAARRPIRSSSRSARAGRCAPPSIRSARSTCPHHQIVSLVGNIAPDGSASFFDTLTRLADLTQARHYPIPLPLRRGERQGARAAPVHRAGEPRP